MAIVTNGIGLGHLAADAVLSGGGRLAQLSPEALAAFDMLLPEGWQAGNPLSLGPAAGARLAEAAAMLAALPEVDSVVALHAPAAEGAGEVAAEAMIAAARAGGQRAAPVLVSWSGQATAGRQRQAMAEAGLAVFRDARGRGAGRPAPGARPPQPRRRGRACPRARWLDLAPDRTAVRRILEAARAEYRQALTEEEALGVLAAYGVPTVPGRRAAGPQEAADAAAMLGFPAVLKILSPDLRHKSEVGGVVLGLSTAGAVRAEAEAMLARVRAKRPVAQIEGFLVQRQAAPALELRLRLGDDTMFGPWIGFGQGGTAADLAEDEAHDLPPLNLALANQLIARSRTARLMAGFRDHAPVNQSAVARVLVRLSQVAVDFPRNRGADPQPALCRQRAACWPADAHLMLRPEGSAGSSPSRLYPAELARSLAAALGRGPDDPAGAPEDAETHG
ncbi:acetate--CoA ligase family protein [Dankookia sp. P2]|uniref:acetate--CoA ligase family protein n=1 Tax=Dankookia sp. P2 TaxID=3423955 RepID=UPI003D669590